MNKTYSISSKIHHILGRSPEINVQIDGIELNIEWYNLLNKLVPRIQVFDDAWGIFPLCADLFAALNNSTSNNANPLTVEQVSVILESCGFVENTSYYSN